MDSLVFARRLSIFLGMVIIGLSPTEFLSGEVVIGIGFFVVGSSIILLGFNQRKPIIPLLAFIILAAFTSSPSRILFFMYTLIFLFFLLKFYGLGQVLGYVVGILAYCSVVSYLTGLLPSADLQMPLLDGLLHLLAAISILSVYPNEGIVAPFHSKYAGGQMARSLIPSLVAIIVIIGPVILSLREHLPFPSEIFLLAMALATTIIMITIAIERLNKMDQSRAKSHQKALDAWQFFKGVVENTRDAIAVLDEKGRIIYKNKQMEKIDFKIHEHWKKFQKDKTPIHIKKTKTNNRYFTGWIIPLDKQKSIISLTEITDLIKAQKQLKETIKEKDSLLRELHHRVKNNLQVIISLLNLQAQKADQKTKRILLEAQNRIKTMAIIHETLYETKTHKIDMQKSMKKLTNSLKTQYKDIKFKTNCKAKFNLETSIPLAMLINELLKESIKRKPSIIKTKIQKHKKEHKLTITDNGTRSPGGGGRTLPCKSINPTT